MPFIQRFGYDRLTNTQTQPKFAEEKSQDISNFSKTPGGAYTHTHTHTRTSEFRLLTSFPISWCVIRYIIFNMKNSTLAISDSMLMIRSKAVVYYLLGWSCVCSLRLCSNLSALCCSFFFIRGTMRHKENKRNWKKDRDVNDSKRKSV